MCLYPLLEMQHFHLIQVFLFMLITQKISLTIPTGGWAVTSLACLNKSSLDWFSALLSMFLQSGLNLFAAGSGCSCILSLCQPLSGQAEGWLLKLLYFLTAIGWFLLSSGPAPNWGIEMQTFQEAPLYSGLLYWIKEVHLSKLPRWVKIRQREKVLFRLLNKANKEKKNLPNVTKTLRKSKMVWAKSTLSVCPELYRPVSWSQLLV